MAEEVFWIACGQGDEEFGGAVLGGFEGDVADCDCGVEVGEELEGGEVDDLLWGGRVRAKMDLMEMNVLRFRGRMGVLSYSSLR